MLQQTQVARVLDFYLRFLARFPNLLTLAEARSRDVVRAWQGLGYYARARNLHRLATHVVREGTGTLPTSTSELRDLPGIGPYTAGAVSSFAFEQPAALVDTNVARVLARVFAPSLHLRRGRDQRRLWQLAEVVLPTRGPAAWTHNQALMEVGALICTARTRHCTRCPVRTHCATYARAGANARKENRSG